MARSRRGTAVELLGGIAYGALLAALTAGLLYSSRYGRVIARDQFGVRTVLGVHPFLLLVATAAVAVAAAAVALRLAAGADGELASGGTDLLLARPLGLLGFVAVAGAVWATAGAPVAPRTLLLGLLAGGSLAGLRLLPVDEQRLVTLRTGLLLTGLVGFILVGTSLPVERNRELLGGVVVAGSLLVLSGVVRTALTE